MNTSPSRSKITGERQELKGGSAILLKQTCAEEDLDFEKETGLHVGIFVRKS